MKTVKVWDLFVRVFHWSVAVLFVANMTVFDEDSLAHAYAGYALFGIVMARLIWGVIGTRHARFRSFWPSRSDLRRHIAGYFQSGPPEVHLSHNPLGALMVFNLLATLVLIGVTGILLGSGVEWVEGPHEVLANYATLCVGLHVLGVLVERRRTGVDLIKAMVTGNKTVPEDHL